MFKEQIKSAVLVFLILTIITGVIYPLFITGFCQLFFHNKANGSLIYKDGKPIGSSLIGQYFDKPEYFWPRPSATSPMPYNAASSSGSNLGPLNPALKDAIKKRIEMYKSADPNNTNAITVDLVTTSASGLDPHISLAGAYYQVSRISRIRNLSQETVKNLINKHTKKRLVGILGEPVVNVLELNVALDEYKK
jgi:K+-transporting ATPase ATPase C chain